jgi:hypothetical protein
MPDNTSTCNNRIGDGLCWYGIKRNKRGDITPCGLDAQLYEVRRCHDFEGPSALSYKAWFCSHHRLKMIDDGFQLTLQP